MESLVALLESERCTNLLLALAHTLWQGPLAAAILFLYLRQTSAEAADKRYVAGLAALGAIVLGVLLTGSILSYEPAPAQDDIATTQIAPESPTFSESTTSTAGGPAFAARTIPESSRSLQTWIMGAWLAGVSLMFLRMVALVIGGGRLRRQCRPLESIETLDLVEQLRHMMGIGRKIRVLTGTHISTPGVIGCFWPTLLLPASMLSGIPADDLRAILVHELAHIRRYDYLINFLQMVVEALLFFHPAVWWISRQIRIEREACCDAVGVQWIGQRTRYAEALVAWAHRIGTPAPAVGFGRDTDPGTLLDRVKRILVAGHQPRPRVPWHIATAMVVLSLACLVLIGQATGLAVALAGRILTSQERIEKIAAISDEYGPRGYSEKDRIQISGVARTWDGKPISGRPVATVRSSQPDGREGLLTTLKTTTQGPNSDQLHFSGSVHYGRLQFSVSAAGYAPASTGPLTAEPGGQIEGIELVLGKGFRTRIQAVDESGHPIEDAEVRVQYTFPPGVAYRFKTNAKGTITLEHATPEKTTLEFTADGFQTERVESIVLDPNVTKVVALKKAQLLTGTVLSEATGRPIEGAEVYALGSTRRNDLSERHHIGGTADASTDASGRFELTRLHRDHKYLLFVRASGYGCQYLPYVRPTDKDIVVELGERRIIRGRVVGDLSLLTKNTKGEPFVEVGHRYDFFDFSGQIGPLTRVPVTIRDGVGHFQVDDPCGRVVTLSVGAERVSVRPEQDPLDDVVLELVRPVLREVVLRFRAPEGAPPVEGNVEVRYYSERDRSGGSKFVEIEDGDARCEIPAPGSFSYSTGNGYRYGKGPIGYWFPEVRSIPIAAGSDPYVIEVPVRPAGAIYGKILGPDGNVAENAREVLYLMNPEILEREPSKFLGHGIQGGPFLMDYANQYGTFKVTPLPLGGKYLVIAWEGNRFAASGTFHLDEKHPIVEVNLQLLQGVKVTGRLLDDKGHPARIPVALYGSPAGPSLDSMGIGASEVTPDEDGRFVFENVSPGSTGICGLSVWPRANYQRVLQRIEDMESLVTIRLQRGLHLRGTVIDNATGWPVPNVMTWAWTAPEGDDYPPGQFPLRLMSEGPTNQRGEFVFSNLSPGRYEVMCLGVTLADGRQAVVATAGQAEPLTIRITIPEGRDLQPRRPQTER